MRRRVCQSVSRAHGAAYSATVHRSTINYQILTPMPTREHLGVVVSGSLTEGLTVRLADSLSVEALRVGQFVVVQGDQHQFFSMISDVELGASNADIIADPPADDDDWLRRVLSGTTTYGSCDIAPMLMLSGDANEGLRPVRTVPRHFAPVYAADAQTFGQVFGEEGPNKFYMGMPLDMDIPVCLDLQRFVERSNGVFGKSGTGKSFLTRLLLCGVIKGNTASALIFDMHSEYGWESKSEGGAFVKGLRQLFPGDVMVYTLDPNASRSRGVAFDSALTLNMDEIEVEDVILLQDELKLNATAAESAYLLVDRFGKQWLQELSKMDADALQNFAETSGGNIHSLSALKRKMAQILRLDFVKADAPSNQIKGLIEALQRGKHVVLEFGHYDSTLAYMLVANVLTRRIHARWVELTDKYFQTRQPADKPQPLVIAIEEAHKFLSPQVSRQTIFGTIARELRKYSVTLLVVDQRPSAIDNEVMSQLGSRITALLNDERDIEAVLTGVSGAAKLRSILASLDSKQQALILGHAVPMPVVIRTRPYDDAFYLAVAPNAARRVDPIRAQADVDDLFG